MDLIKSKVNPKLTLEYMTTEVENKYFDRKSGKIKPSDLSNLISAFANAEGGTIVIGISDKSKKIEGLNQFGEEKINNFISSPKEYCKPMPSFEEEFLEVVDHNGDINRILLIHIKASIDQIIYTKNDSAYLRIADKTKEVKGENLRNLEFSKSTRHYENECNMDAKVSDLDEELIQKYKYYLDAEDLSTEQVLSARGFIKKVNGEERLTNAAVLLFAKNILQFYPNCRIRFIRYEGNTEQTGTRMNVIKDKNIEYPILRIIDEALEFIGHQLREFTALNKETGKFQTVPEYPEFAWQEGIINAVTHREYGLSGAYIKVSMFDDRLEIQSPGRLPYLVTVDNIRETRYSRNPSIARVLTSFGWVRELNEGVKRIYSEMEEFFLEDPIYSEDEQTVKLVLKNNIVMRSKRSRERLVENVGTQVWEDLDELERSILVYMGSNSKVTRLELEKYTNKSSPTVRKRLNHLLKLNLINRNETKYDPKQTYSIVD